MAETANTGAAAQDGGLTSDAIKLMIADALKPIAEAIAPLNKAVESLAQNQKILADTMAKIPAADAQDAAAIKDAAAKDGKTQADGNAAKTLTEEQVAKIVADTLAKHEAQRQQTAEQQAARDAFVKDPKNGLAKLPPEYHTRLGNDPTKWPEEAKAIVGSWENFAKAHGITLADVGGATREGGDTPGATAAATKSSGTTLKWAAGLGDDAAATAQASAAK